MPEAGRAHRLEPAADARLVAPGALRAYFDDAVVGKQIDDVVPHLAVLVETVGRLEIADAVLVIEAVDPLLERGERHAILECAALGCRADDGRDRNAGRICGVVAWNHRQVAATPIGPAGVVGAVELGIVVGLCDLPDAALADIFILEHAAFDPRLPARAVEGPRLPAHLGAVAVGREVRYRRVDHHRRQTIGLEALVAAAVARAQKRGDCGGPLGGLLRHDQAVEDEATVWCEQRADLIPQAGLRVVGIGALKVQHRPQAFGAVDLAREIVKRVIGTGWHRHREQEHGPKRRRPASDDGKRVRGTAAKRHCDSSIAWPMTEGGLDWNGLCAARRATAAAHRSDLSPD